MKVVGTWGRICSHGCGYPVAFFFSFFSLDLLSFAHASSVLKVSRAPPVIITDVALKGEDEGRGKQSKSSKYSWMKKGGKSSVLLAAHFSKHHKSLFALNFVVLRLSRSVLSRSGLYKCL